MTIFSAAEARIHTEEIVHAQTAELESMVMTKINDAIRRGDSEVMVSLTGKSVAATAAVRQSLRDAGYTLKDSTGDQRDYGYVTISWAAP